jgi:hypothetical protein
MLRLLLLLRAVRVAAVGHLWLPAAAVLPTGEHAGRAAAAASRKQLPHCGAITGLRHIPCSRNVVLHLSLPHALGPARRMVLLRRLITEETLPTRCQALLSRLLAGMVPRMPRAQPCRDAQRARRAAAAHHPRMRAGGVGAPHIRRRRCRALHADLQTCG